MSRSHHARHPLKHELNRPGGGYMPRGRFSKTVAHRQERREPVLTLDDYSWPEPWEPDFWDEDDELRALEADDLELVWSDLIFGSRDDDDFELCSCRERREPKHLDDFEDASDPYEDRW
jgi:hypothetical protein